MKKIKSKVKNNSNTQPKKKQSFLYKNRKIIIIWLLFYLFLLLMLVIYGKPEFDDVCNHYCQKEYGRNGVLVPKKSNFVSKSGGTIPNATYSDCKCPRE